MIASTINGFLVCDKKILDIKNRRRAAFGRPKSNKECVSIVYASVSSDDALTVEDYLLLLIAYDVMKTP